MLKLLMIVGAGGFTGSVARYLLSVAMHKNHPGTFPWGTFVVNIIGCFLIGSVYAIAERGNMLSHEVRVFLAVGICGGFTTFSAFASENMFLLRNGEFVTMLLYTVSSVLLGFLATYLGNLVIRFF